jgi:3-methyladenine DNA glycosylase AlkD
MTAKKVMAELKRLSNPNPKDLAGMARYGINTDHAWVISVPKLRNYAKELKKELNRHEIALEIWDTEVHEARILAGFIDDPEKVTDEQLEKWVKDFDSWDVCDLVCSELFDKTKFAYQKAEEWSERQEEFVKRAGFVIMCALAVHDKKATDQPFEKFLKICERESSNERNFVKKAVNWTIRNIGKTRNIALHEKALKTAYQIKEKGDKASRWIANDAIRELESEKIRKRFF